MGATILFVCTGNLCRSPYMELVFEDMIKRRGLIGVRALSAGTRAVTGDRIASPMAEILQADGIDTSGFLTQAVTPAMIQAASVVITAERGHRAEVCRVHATALRKIFTLRQAERLLSSGWPAVEGHEESAEPFEDLVVSMAKRRGRGGPASQEDDVVDPWQRGRDVYQQAVVTMEPALELLAGAAEFALAARR